jgi:hypothetical protein
MGGLWIETKEICYKGVCTKLYYVNGKVYWNFTDALIEWFLAGGWLFLLVVLANICLLILIIDGILSERNKRRGGEDDAGSAAPED